ncbi:MAG TPA: alpha/beta hydrolase, partial [Archangium sp.]
ESVPRVPTVFVTADRKPNDSIRKSHEALAEGLGVPLVSWPNAAHNLQLDHPDETLEVVRSLVARVTAGESPGAPSRSSNRE